MRRASHLLLTAAVGTSALALYASSKKRERAGDETECCARAPSRASLTQIPAALASSASIGPAAVEPVEGMVRIEGGRFWMGSDDPEMPDASPWHQVTVAPFLIDRTEVTNADFERFVRATGYVTTAERRLDPRQYPGVPADALVPAGIVFAPPESPGRRSDPLAWWRLVPGASWRRPEGPGSSIVGRERYPVVQVSWDDAAAYAKWAGKRLPTEAEWEMAARGGLVKKPFTWGDELRPGGRWLVNVWQGTFPTENTAEDGFAGLAPVGSFPPNGFGLYDMAGNVWEWTADWYRPDYYAKSPANDPRGPADSFDPDEPGVPKRVTKGGSFLCARERCRRYQPGGRGKAAPDSGTSHTGFRCVRSP
jgi:formylglycine-generating enzyme required for sulfatase activity